MGTDECSSDGENLPEPCGRQRRLHRRAELRGAPIDRSAHQCRQANMDEATQSMLRCQSPIAAISFTRHLFRRAPVLLL